VVADEAGEGHEGLAKTGLAGTQANAAISTDVLLGDQVTKNGRLLLVRHVERLLEHEQEVVKKGDTLVVTLHVHDRLGTIDELARNSKDLRSSLGKTDFLLNGSLDLSSLELSERGVAVGPPFSLLLGSADVLSDATSEIASKDDAITSPLAGVASEHLLQVSAKETEEVRVTQSKADDSSAVTVVNEILADLVNHLLREGNELAVLAARNEVSTCVNISGGQIFLLLFLGKVHVGRVDLELNPLRLAEQGHKVVGGDDNVLHVLGISLKGMLALVEVDELELPSHHASLKAVHSQPDLSTKSSVLERERETHRLA
jgi:hypothetical protein